MEQSLPDERQTREHALRDSDKGENGQRAPFIIGMALCPLSVPAPLKVPRGGTMTVAMASSRPSHLHARLWPQPELDESAREPLEDFAARHGYDVVVDTRSVRRSGRPPGAKCRC